MRMRNRLSPLAVALLFAVSSPGQLRLPNQARPTEPLPETKLAPSREGAGPWQIEVPGKSIWVDTGIDLKAGDVVRAEVTGSLTRGGKSIGPNGGARGWTDMTKAFPVISANPGAVIGRIGNSPASRAFLIGERREAPAPAGGRLFLSVNFAGADTAEGAFQVTVTRLEGTARSANGYSGPPFTEELLNRIPLRVVDDAGTPGDRTNFVIIGSEKQVVESLEAAGWVQVDKDVKSTIFRGALASLTKQAYLTIPMSQLKLFDRYQDYGWAQADPIQVVAARHHFRIWKTPFDLGGRTVWAGAGTHDVGFDKDQRNGKVTHKIDPEVDKERDYIGESLKQTGIVAKTEYLTPKNPVKEAKTAHGQTYYSDGRTLILYFHDEKAAVAGTLR
jgi:hypothetical protein